MTSVHDLFMAALERGPDRVCLRTIGRDGEIVHSYREVAGAIARLVERLRAGGANRGDRVVIYADAIVPSIHLMLACSFAGVAFAPIAPTFSPQAARTLAQRIGSTVVLTTPEHVERLAAAGITAVADATLIEPHPPSPADLDTLRACCTGRSADETYIILSTSGSTGEPKLPVRRHIAFTWPAQRYAQALGLTGEPREKLLLCSGLTHGLGQVVLALGMHVGAELCIPRGLESAIALADVDALAPTVICAHPRVLQALYDQHVARGGDPSARYVPSSLRFARVGGSSYDPDLLHKLAAHGVDVGEWYGASETAVVAITPRGHWRAGEIGPICAGVEVRIADDQELLVRSPAQMTGYYGDEPLTRDTITEDGFILTGDLGAVTDGVLRLLGRKKEVLNAPDGTNIAAAPIEARIAALAWVDQVVLVGDGRPCVTALVVMRDGPANAASDGYLEERDHLELYTRARTDLNAINAKLEPVEQVRGFAVFGSRFPTALYGEVGLGKIRRDRPGIIAAYRAQIDAMYERVAARPLGESPAWHAKAWDASADVFDADAMSFLVRIGARAVELLDLAPGARVIDCACGSGNSSLVAAAIAGPTGRVIGVDVSDNLLDLARAKAAARGLGNLELVNGDMQTIAFGDGQFDAVLCVFGLFFVPDMVEQVRTFWRHLRPGGRLGIAVWSAEALEPARQQIWVPSLRAEIPELLARNAARDRISESDQVRSIFDKAGVIGTEFIACRELQTLRSPDDWWQILLGLGPTRWFIDHMTDDQRERVRKRNVDWVGERGLATVNVDWIFARATKQVTDGRR